MSDLLTSWLRTIVPALWSALVAWLVAHAVLPSGLATALNGFGQQLLVPIVLALVYAGLRKLEPHLPRWLTRVLIGSPRQPSYAPAPATATTTPTPAAG